MEFQGKLKSYGSNHMTIDIPEGFDIQEIRRKTLDGMLAVDFYEKAKITAEQRKLIFALVGDICQHTGYPDDEMHIKMKYYFMAETGCEVFSLARNKVTKEFAATYIEFIIEWCLKENIPFMYREYHLSADINRTLFIYLKYRACFVCGKKNSQIAHVETVGSGRNRNKIDHRNHHFMCLCGEKHHPEQHNIGIDTFMKKHHLAPIKLDEQTIISLGLMSKKQLYELNKEEISNV